MVKLIGAIMLVCSAFGWASCLMQKKGRQIQRIRALCDFLLQTEYAMKNEHVNMVTYMQNVNANDETLKNTVRMTGRLLEDMAVPYGEMAWEQACLQMKQQWDMPMPIWENILDCKYVFFGKSLMENIEKSKGVRNRLLEQEQEQKQKLSELKKIVYPVSILLSILVVLLLI